MIDTEGSRQQESALAYPALLVLAALDAAGYSILAPVLPTTAATASAGPAVMGLLVASFPTAMLAGFAIAGYTACAARPSPPSCWRRSGCSGWAASGSRSARACPATALQSPATPPTFRPDRTALRLPGFWLAAAGILLAVLGLGISEGVLPLRLATYLDQTQIGGLYVGIAILVAASSAVAGSIRPRPALATVW